MIKVTEVLEASHVWRRVFWILLVVGIALHLVTLSYSPVPWQDEVQVVEIGQGGVGEKTSGWNMCMTGNEEFDKQAWALYYLGGLGEELFYQMFGRFGPRLFTLIGLFLATVLFHCYVRRRTKSEYWAAVLGVLFFAAPSLVQSVRGARVDVWTFVCLWSGLNLLYGIGDSCTVKSRIRYGLAGASAVLACFFWASAVLLLPIYMWAFWENYRHPVRDWKKLSLSSATVVAFAVFATLILILPFCGRLEVTMELASWISAHNTNTRSSATVIHAVKVLCGEVVGFPYIFLFGIIGIVLSRRNWWLKIGVVAFIYICVFVAARIYVFRMLYLLVYAFVGIILLVGCLSEKIRARNALALMMTLIACAVYGRSVLLRNGIEFLARDGRDFHKIRAALANEIAEGDKVYAESYQIYYVARDLGWKLYRSVGGPDAKDALLDDVQHVITENRTPDYGVYMREHGFLKKKEVAVPFKPFTDLEKRIISLAGRGASCGPYVIYSR